MTVEVAEYLGQNTNSNKKIVPVHLNPEDIDEADIPCPFKGSSCTKISGYSKPPVCSLYTYPTNDTTQKKMYIVCEHRLISTSTKEVTEYQREMLLKTGKVLFHPDIQSHELAYKSEQYFKKIRSRADFVLALVGDDLTAMGPDRMIVEVQGGGETSNTGDITAIVNEWAKHPAPKNEYLRQSTTKAAPIPVNAWRRQQQQLLAKARTAKETGYGFAILFGEVVFDYVINRIIPDIVDMDLGRDGNWNTAFVPFVETKNDAFDTDFDIDTERVIYTTLDNFIRAVQDKKVDSDHDSFNGEYTTLDGTKVEFNSQE